MLNVDKIEVLKSREVELLQRRAFEISKLGLPPVNAKVAALLDEECSLVEAVPTGIQGWNCSGPTQTPQVVLVGRNTCMMSYVETPESVIEGMFGADQ